MLWNSNLKHADKSLREKNKSTFWQLYNFRCSQVTLFKIPFANLCKSKTSHLESKFYIGFILTIRWNPLTTWGQDRQNWVQPGKPVTINFIRFSRSGTGFEINWIHPVQLNISATLFFTCFPILADKFDQFNNQIIVIN